MEEINQCLTTKNVVNFRRGCFPKMHREQKCVLSVGSAGGSFASCCFCFEECLSTFHLNKSVQTLEVVDKMSVWQCSREIGHRVPVYVLSPIMIEKEKSDIRRAQTERSHQKSEKGELFCSPRATV